MRVESDMCAAILPTALVIFQTQLPIMVEQ